jgi:cell division septum initiation protein DivIVA
MVEEARAEAEQTVAHARHEAERAVAEGRRQFTDLTDRARAEAERLDAAGRAAHDRYLADGLAEQARLVSQTEIVRNSHAEGARVVDAADAEAERLRRECDGYVDTKLAEFEDTLGKALRTVSQGRSQLWRGGPPHGAPSRGRSGTGMDLID